MSGGFLIAAGIGAGVALVSTAVLTAVGLHVVKLYPDPLDPDRNARRYTRPAAIAAGIAAAGMLTLAVGLIGAIVSIIPF